MQTTAFKLWMAVLPVLAASCHAPKENKPAPMEVKTQQVLPCAAAGQEEFSFMTAPYRTSELSFRVSGPIDRLDVFAGNFYRRGSIIAEIDPRDFRIRKERAEAAYRQAKAEYERVEKLFRKNNVAASLFEKAEADFIAARTAWNTACYELEDTRLIAPFNGYVGEVFVEKFQDVKVAQPVLTLMDIDRLRIELYVTQQVAMEARQGGTVKLRFDARPDTVYTARVTEVSKGTTDNTLSYLLTALLPNEDHRWLAGMSGKAWIDLPQAAPTAAATTQIPLTALCHRPQTGDFVWTVDTVAKRVKLRPVKRGRLLPQGSIEVKEGLEAGETVATSGLRFLADGMEVTTR